MRYSIIREKVRSGSSMELCVVIVVILIVCGIVKIMINSAGSSNKYNPSPGDTTIEKLSKNEMRYRQYKGKGRPEYGARWSAYQDGKKSKKR